MQFLIDKHTQAVSIITARRRKISFFIRITPINHPKIDIYTSAPVRSKTAL